MFIIPDEYSKKYLEYERINPVFSKKITSVINEIIDNRFDSNFLDNSYLMIENSSKKNIIESFKEKMLFKFKSSKLNNLTGFDRFNQIDICLGCTQYIDNLYLLKSKNNIQVLDGEYRYHYRLYPDMIGSTALTLINNKDLIISLPFVTGNIHDQMDKILEECLDKEIKIHLDCAWLSAARDIKFDFSHPAIETVGLSLSKGFGLGWNRIGLRLSKNKINDSIKLMNDFQMIPTLTVTVGHHFLDNIEIDHLWNEHYIRYDKICKDFNLIKTNSIHLAHDNERMAGTCNLIRFLEEKND
jgi:hypothetical protein